MEVDDEVDGGVAARLRCKDVDGRGVDGAREECVSNGDIIAFDDEEDDDSPIDRLVLRTKRLLPGRSRSRSMTL